MSARLLFPVALVVLLDVYGYFALRPLVQRAAEPGAAVETALWFKVAWWGVTACALVLLVLIATGVEPEWPRAVSVPLRALFFILYFSKFVASFFFLLDDLRRLLQGVYQRVATPVREGFWPDRSRFLTQVALLAGGLPAAVLSYGIIRNPYRYRVHEVEVPIVGLSPRHVGLRIAQISDIHSGSFFRTDPIADGIAALNDLAPDVACFTGDLVNARAEEIEPYIDIFSRVDARYGTYSIIGNHDYGSYVREWGEAERAANWERLYANHRALGWDLLLNEHRLLDVDGEPLAIVGVENWSQLRNFPRTGDLAAATAGTEEVLTKVLLSHDPTHWPAEVMGHRPDIQLQLSGHTHGFQFGIEIPGFRWSPSQYVYEHWAGLYTQGQQHLYVNRGYGFLGYPGRVGILPEVTLLKLVAA